MFNFERRRERTSGEIQGGDLPVEYDVVRAGVAPRIPEPYPLVEVAADDGGTGRVGRHHVVARGAGEFGLDACRQMKICISESSRRAHTRSYQPSKGRERAEGARALRRFQVVAIVTQSRRLTVT